jgi:hypothetical protein
MILAVAISANVLERKGAKLFFAKLHRIYERFPRFIGIRIDRGHEVKDSIHLAMDTYRLILKTIKRYDTAKGFVFLPRHWVVERTFGWFN